MVEQPTPQGEDTNRGSPSGRLFRTGEVADAAAPDLDAAAVGIPQSGHQVEQSGLSRSRLTDNGDGLPWVETERDILEGGWLSVIPTQEKPVDTPYVQNVCISIDGHGMCRLWLIRE